MKERIAQIIQHVGLTYAEFADKVGISNSSLSHIMAERNKPSLSLLLSIHDAYPQININWLLFGEGNMLMSQTSAIDTKPANDDNLPQTALFFEPELLHTETAVQTASTPQADTSNPSFELVKNMDGVNVRMNSDRTSCPRITEIRVFYDNGTYEVFTSDTK